MTFKMRYHTSDMNGKFKDIDLLPTPYLGVRGKKPKQQYFKKYFSLLQQHSTCSKARLTSLTHLKSSVGGV